MCNRECPFYEGCSFKPENHAGLMSEGGADFCIAKKDIEDALRQQAIRAAAQKSADVIVIHGGENKPQEIALSA